jgi:hypothetical protein
MEVQMQWLDESTETAKPAPAKRKGPPKLPGLPTIPPMPVAASEVPAQPSNKTMEVDPAWLEEVKERRAQKSAQPAAAPAKPAAAPAKPAAAPAKPAAPAAKATPVRPRIRPIPREDE